MLVSPSGSHGKGTPAQQQLSQPAFSLQRLGQSSVMGSVSPVRAEDDLESQLVGETFTIVGASPSADTSKDCEVQSHDPSCLLNA